MQEEQQILSRVIVEIAGKPKEHIESTMKLVLQKIKESKDIKIEKEEKFKFSGFGADFLRECMLES